MNPNIKSYALHSILAILVALLQCGCRSSSQHSSMRVSQQKDSSYGRVSEKAHGSIASNVQSHADIAGNTWKITWHFDTSQPADPATGLPPASSMEIEGSEIRKHVEKQENVSYETSDSLSYHKVEESTSKGYSEENSERQKQSGTSIERSIATGILLIFIVIVFIIYVRSNPSKQNH